MAGIHLCLSAVLQSQCIVDRAWYLTIYLHEIELGISMQAQLVVHMLLQPYSRIVGQYVCYHLLARRVHLVPHVLSLIRFDLLIPLQF